MDPKHKKIAEAVRAQGISHFLVGFKNGPIASIYFEDMKIREAMEVMISGFHQTIALELDKHPEYSKEYADIWRELAKDFNGIIKKADEKLKSFNDKKK